MERFGLICSLDSMLLLVFLWFIRICSRNSNIINKPNNFFQKAEEARARLTLERKQLEAEKYRFESDRQKLGSYSRYSQSSGYDSYNRSSQPPADYDRYGGNSGNVPSRYMRR